MSRRADLDAFYTLLRQLERHVGGPRLLAECTGRMAWPQRGVYFFFENGEYREDGAEQRVVLVGTHGLRAGGKSTLCGRLGQHRGTGSGDRLGGNHRGSVFRLHVGQALLTRGLHPEAGDSWAAGSSAPP